MTRGPAGRPDTARLVAAGAVANLAVGTLFAWSLVAPRVVADAGAPRGSGPAVFALALGVFTVVLLGVGRWLARVGPRRLLAAAALAAGSGIGVTAVVQRPEAPWLGVGLLFGAANGLAYGVAVALAARVPAVRRGTASGVVVGAYAAGPVLLGLLAPRVLPVVGWRTCLAVLAVLVAGLVGLAAALAPGGAEGEQRRDRFEEPVPGTTVAALWVLFAGGAAPGLVVFATAAPLASATGLGPGAAGAAVSLLAAGNLAGRLGAGWWSDRAGRLPALATALAATAVALAGLAVRAAPAVVLTGFLVVGLAYGGVSALVPAATADRVGVRAFPAVYGRVFTAWGCAGLLAPLLAASVTDADGTQPGLLLLAVPLALAAAALSVLARR
ncbi:MFS transporter [Geodermatophilus obscurus]|uniref:Major facilitator superfamily MFS_1 n=1 Tax=Geodermatophilus obscurus (strain ATCC 25078 / DSM 43160 / JCM 3152 / CCUG 61914 / KCC A-0152 / KCTC 9177 / NBRC 13315 / NRRL B-3577 / G-20) TaxID=526225 RepID=D2S458_GEOOG|nr:MFS transporter [Geodermatophilus obscurus]ADB75048.1 major facilitator superfamily MFS_1 [Geodermatophilus obscurus DSM 43160]